MHRMRICVLASGSKGNATYVEGGGVRLLIDAGISCRDLEKRLAAVGESPDGLDGILITHEHIDHVRGLARFVDRHGTPVFANEGTAAVVERQCRLEGKSPPPDFTLFESRVPFALGGLTVTPVRTSHDTAEPVAYTLDDGAARLGYFTDLGFVSGEVADALAACDALVLESNHDLTMLRESGRPFALISRIAGDSGHLSNDQACEAVARCASPNLRALVLAHLSEECNQPAVARACMARALKARGLAPALAVAEQSVPLPFLEV